MRNQSGLTLIEVLAVLMLSSVILGVAYIGLTSIQSQFFTSSEMYKVNTEMKSTVQLLSNELSQASRVNFHNNQLRYKRGGVYMVFYYDEMNHSLWQYRYNENGKQETLETQFENHLNNLSTTPNLYTSPTLVTESLAEAPTYSLAEGAHIGTSTVAAGATIEIFVQFKFTSTGVNAAKKLIDNSDAYQSMFRTVLIIDY
jgi:prepilin-type N-terminal cleavage/methylation domain-containing protein